MLELLAFIITLTIPGYLIADRHFNGLEKIAVSLFLSLSITSFIYYFLVSFLWISREFIYFYAVILFFLFVFLKKPDFNKTLISLKEIRLEKKRIELTNIPAMLIVFLLVIVFSFTVFSTWNFKFINYDDSSYHLPIVFDIADDGKKTFFLETKNIYEVRSNQFPLLFESFAGSVKLFIGSNFHWLSSFYALLISLFFIFLLSRLLGYNEVFSAAFYGLTPVVLVFSTYFGVESFLSMFFLASVFFALKFIQSENILFVLLSGFSLGLMFLTKFTGIIFFVPVLLFFLFKKKYKQTAVFFIVFFLISLVFFVSHLNVPIEKEGVGDYGKFASGNLFEKISANIIKLSEILFHYFRFNFYLFFIPFLFVLGILWFKQKEKELAFLLFSCLILFLLITFFNKALPTYSGFPRYFLPVYSLMCVFAGMQLKKIMLKDKKTALFFGFLFIFLLAFSSVTILSHFSGGFSSAPANYSGKGIDNIEGIKVWFVNGAALQIRLDKAELYDYVWKADFSGNPCEFLRKNEIDYVVFFHVDVDPPELGDFGKNLRQSLFNGDCSEVFHSIDNSVNSVTFKIHR